MKIAEHMVENMIIIFRMNSDCTDGIVTTIGLVVKQTEGFQVK